MAHHGKEYVEIGGRRVSVTNLDKVMYPQTGTTKGQVIDYFTAIAPAMLPHLVDRAVTRKRWPDGLDHKPFFEKNLPTSAPDWIERHAVAHRHRYVQYPVLNSVAALAWAGQQAALELHVPQWRFVGGQLGPVTRLVFDLDPGEGTGLAECAVVARAIADLVEELGWTPYPVTSGSKGMHLYVPLPRQLPDDGASTVAKQVAVGLQTLLPDLVTATMAKAARAGKVFVDWSQNNPSKTTIAPYSLRGRDQPWVAAPRTWAEIADPDLRQLTYEEVLQRFYDDGDLLAELDPPVASADRLDTYRGMRDPRRTPEPIPPEVYPHGNDDTFVIQEHHARRLHYDFRLERDGVLVSWAVPKNLPTTSTKNHLAVHTEDHPIEYASFAGTIPKGEYGAGSVEIWDSGTYETEKWRDDEIIVCLHGSRVSGRHALIRTDGTQWLVHRTKDQPEGVDAASTPLRSAEFPRAIAPMLATAGTAAALSGFSTQQWAFEGKWDGVRALVFYQQSSEKLEVRSRIGRDKLTDYPQLRTLANVLAGHDVVLDGEVVAWDSRQVTSFPLLQEGSPPTYLVFDILFLDGVSLVGKSYADRRLVLEAFAKSVGGLNVPPPLAGSASGALNESRRAGWEGIVAKRRDSIYLPASRARSWIKIKNWRTQHVVIGGWQRGQGARAGSLGSLLLGIPEGNGVEYVGKVGTGFSAKERARLLEAMSGLACTSSPFTGELPAAARGDAVWVTPELVGEVRFMEWTAGGRLRHASWRGLREDIPISDVRRE